MFRFSTTLIRIFSPEDPAAVSADLTEEESALRDAGHGWLYRMLWRAGQVLMVCTHGFADRTVRPPLGVPPRRRISMWGLRCRLALRALAARPGFTLAGMLTLGLGLGGSTVMFSVIDGFKRPLPVPEGEQIVRVIWRQSSHRAERGFEPADLELLNQRQTSFDQLAGFRSRSAIVTREGEFPEPYSAADVTANTARILQIKPMLGRFLNDGDRGVVVISHAFWSDAFGLDAGVLGRTLRLDGALTTIVGVMPPDFAFPFRQSLWLPLRSDSGALGSPDESEELEAFGRLTGVSRGQAEAELAGLTAGLWSRLPGGEQERRVSVIGFTEQRGEGGENMILFGMGMIALLVLLVAIGNAMSLFLARSVERMQDLALHAAIGARGGQIVANLLTESLLLTTGGGLVGIAFTFGGVAVINHSLSSMWGYHWMDVRVDATVWGVATLLVLGSALLVGLVPAVSAARTDPNEVLRQARRTPGRSLPALTRAFVISEVAVSCLALIATGTIAKTLVGYGQISPQLAADRTVLAVIDLPQARYPATPQRARYWSELRRGVEDKPGVEHATIARSLPGWGMRAGRFELAEAITPTVEQPRDWSYRNDIDLSFFGAFGMQLLRGRGFSTADVDGAPRVAVVNESFTSTFLGGQDPLGTRLRFLPDNEWVTVVGVVSDLSTTSMGEMAQDRVYLPFAQSDLVTGMIAVRTAGETAAAEKMLRGALHELDAELIPRPFGTYQGVLDWGRSFLETVSLMAVAGGIGALSISMVGLCGLVAFYIRQRTRELGIRMALGAKSFQVVAIVAGHGVRELLPGLFVGWIVAWFAAPRVLDAMGGRAHDPLFFVGVPALFLAAGIVACLPSALLALRLRPADILRAQ